MAGGALTKALGSKKTTVIVHLWDPKPDALDSFAIDDVSEACRKAGAAAVLVSPSLVGAVAKEQEVHRGSFPGPLPVIADCALNDFGDSPQELCSGAKNLGASAVGIRFYERDWEDAAALEEALRTIVAAAEEAGLGALLLGEFGADGAEGTDGAGGLASRVGAAAGIAKRGDEEGDGGSGVALGCWDGSQNELQRLRESGFAGLVLKDACNGDIAHGAKIKSPSLAAQAVSFLVKAALSKGSKTIWAGAGITGGGQSDSEKSAASYFDNRGG